MSRIALVALLVVLPVLSFAGEPLRITLPAEARPYPEGSDAATPPAGFAIRGTKGWNWTPEQYLAEIPFIARYRMNFLMNCYLSMYSDPPHFKNEWWLPIPEPKKRAYAQIIAVCRKAQIQFCFCMHPQLHSPRPVDLASEADFEKFFQHFAWAQSEGVQWFCVPFDDIGGVRIDGTEHARFVNRMLRRLQQNDRDAKFIICPTHYWGDPASPGNRPYLEALGRELDAQVYVFWTGPDVVSPKISRAEAETFRKIVNHRVIIWDNYPVNDANPTMHLGPVTGRGRDLAEAADGYMSNPMCSQNQINRLAMLTCADYAFNPKAYDPMRSIGQSILQLSKTPDQRQALKELVELYPGNLNAGQSRTAWNPVREAIGNCADRAEADAMLRQLTEIRGRFRRAFGEDYPDAQATLDADIACGRAAVAKRFSPDGGARN